MERVAFEDLLARRGVGWLSAALHRVTAATDEGQEPADAGRVCAIVRVVDTLPKRLRRRLAEVEEGAALALEALLRAPGAEGAPTDRDPALAARVLVKVVEALTHDFVLHPAGLGEEERYVEEVTELVARYLGGGRG